MVLDAELAAALATSVALHDDGSEIDWVGRRALVAERRTPEPLVPADPCGFEDLGLARPDGSTLAARLYRPRARSADHSGPRLLSRRGVRRRGPRGRALPV